MEGKTTVLRAEPREDFVVTPTIEKTCNKALSYLDAGYAVHLYGPAGTGKTTLAMHIAGIRGRPVMLIYGDEEFGTSDLLGANRGVLTRRVIDNFIHSVLKTEESVRTQWVDERITTACKYGYTVVYDEFSRSRPEANNALLSILEEKILTFSGSRQGGSYMQVHPDFRAIFTSNPEEYAGVHKMQDALMDRMVGIELGHYDRDTQIAITASRSGLGLRDAAKVVDIVNEYGKRSGGSFKPTLRASIMIATVAANGNAWTSADDPVFFETCRDVLTTRSAKTTGDGDATQELREIIAKHCRTQRRMKEA